MHFVIWLVTLSKISFFPWIGLRIKAKDDKNKVWPLVSFSYRVNLLQQYINLSFIQNAVTQHIWFFAVMAIYPNIVRSEHSAGKDR